MKLSYSLIRENLNLVRRPEGKKVLLECCEGFETRKFYQNRFYVLVASCLEYVIKDLNFK